MHALAHVSIDNTFHVNNTTYGLVVTFGLKFFILFIMGWFIKQKYLKKKELNGRNSLNLVQNERQFAY